jgi:hypothetical protein
MKRTKLSITKVISFFRFSRSAIFRSRNSVLVFICFAVPNRFLFHPTLVRVFWMLWCIPYPIVASIDLFTFPLACSSTLHIFDRTCTVSFSSTNSHTTLETILEIGAPLHPEYPNKCWMKKEAIGYSKTNKDKHRVSGPKYCWTTKSEERNYFCYAQFCSLHYFVLFSNYTNQFNTNVITRMKNFEYVSAPSQLRRWLSFPYL